MDFSNKFNKQNIPPQLSQAQMVYGIQKPDDSDVVFDEAQPHLVYGVQQPDENDSIFDQGSVNMVYGVQQPDDAQDDAPNIEKIYGVQLPKPTIIVEVPPKPPTFQERIQEFFRNLFGRN